MPPAEANASPSQGEPAEEAAGLPPCPCCGGRMIVIEFFERGMQPRYRRHPNPHPDRHVMSWSQLLDRRVPPHLVAGPQAEKTHALPRRTPSVKVTAKLLPPELPSRPPNGNPPEKASRTQKALFAVSPWLRFHFNPHRHRRRPGFLLRGLSDAGRAGEDPRASIRPPSETHYDTRKSHSEHM